MLRFLKFCYLYVCMAFLQPQHDQNIKLLQSCVMSLVSDNYGNQTWPWLCLCHSSLLFHGTFCYSWSMLLHESILCGVSRGVSGFRWIWVLHFCLQLVRCYNSFPMTVACCGIIVRSIPDMWPGCRDLCMCHYRYWYDYQMLYPLSLLYHFYRKGNICMRADFEFDCA